MRLLALLLCACGAVPLGDEITRGQAYALVRPASCNRIQRCAPAQFAREYASMDECLTKERPRFPESSEVSYCSRPEAEACVDAQDQQPCDVHHVAECEGC